MLKSNKMLINIPKIPQEGDSKLKTIISFKKQRPNLGMRIEKLSKS
jgi:hypothetical protein